MFASRIVTRIAKVAGQRKAHTTAGIMPKFLQDNVWKKSTPLYLAYIFGGVIVLEYVFGSLGDYLWDVNNFGKQFKDIDWSTFKSIEDEDEE